MTRRVVVARIGPGFTTRVKGVKKGVVLDVEGVVGKKKFCPLCLKRSPSPQNATIFAKVVCQWNWSFWPHPAMVLIKISPFFGVLIFRFSINIDYTVTIFCSKSHLLVYKCSNFIQFPFSWRWFYHKTASFLLQRRLLNESLTIANTKEFLPFPLSNDFSHICQPLLTSLISRESFRYPHSPIW